MKVSLNHSYGRKLFASQLPPDVLSNLPGGGMSTDSFLTQTSDNRVDSRAPYNPQLGGADTIALHQLVRSVVRENQAGATPSTVHGLAEGFHTMASRSSQASQTALQEAQRLRERPLSQKTKDAFAAVKARANGGLRRITKTGLQATLAFAAVTGVGLAGVALNQVIMPPENVIKGAAAWSQVGIVGGGFAALVGIVCFGTPLLALLGDCIDGASQSFRKPAELDGQALQLNQQSSLQTEMASHLEKWDQALRPE